MTPAGVGPAGSIVTVGTFDGVHAGHRAVLEEIARRARDAGRASVLVTFEPHPLAVVNPAAAPPRLTTADERLEVLATSELDRVVLLRFDRAMAAMGPEQFVDDVLIARCGMRELVIGHDHGFGKGRQGDVTTLQELGAARGFGVDVVDAVVAGGGTVSSTAIRRAIAGGDLAGAARQLGRSYSVSGTVQHGAGRGRTIGVPTLNLAAAPDKLLPPDGVYAVVADTPAGRFGGMMNQGHRPTFNDGQRLLEVHLFGFEGDLYDRSVRVAWVAPIRGIRRFADAAALRQQLEQDAVRARAALAAAHPDLAAPSGRHE
ncbi:MAG: riboflavin biosynthesis protein RibF [Gemmatimonadales bacterium]|nr:riboflavin biosynthesis protein RibF [Gemmatimonadales bacterium]